MNIQKISLVFIALSTLTIGACKKKGCTDSAALNYDAKAKKDDNSCEYKALKEGCMDPSADNYDASAEKSNESCLYTGCMEVNAENYNSQANVDCQCCTDKRAKFAGTWTRDSDNCDNIKVPLKTDLSISFDVNTGTENQNATITGMFTAGQNIEVTVDDNLLTIPNQDAISITVLGVTATVEINGTGLMNVSGSDTTIVFNLNWDAGAILGSGICTATYSN